MTEELSFSKKEIYFQLFEPTIGKFCFQKCVRKDNSINALNQNCIDGCQAKMINTYNFMMNVVETGGIQRDSTVQRMKGVF